MPPSKASLNPYDNRPGSDFDMGWPVTSEAAKYCAQAGVSLADYPDLAAGPTGARELGNLSELLKTAGIAGRTDLEKMLKYTPVEHLALKLSQITGADDSNAHRVAESAILRNLLLEAKYHSLFSQELDPTIVDAKLEPKSIWDNPTKEEMIERLDKKGPGITFSTDSRLRVQPPITRTRHDQVTISNGMKVFGKDGAPYYEGGDHARHFPWFSLTMGQRDYKPEALRRFLSLLLSGISQQAHPEVEKFFQQFENDPDFAEIIQLLKDDPILAKRIQQVEVNNEIREREITTDLDGKSLEYLMDLPRDVVHDRDALDAFEQFTKVNAGLKKFIGLMKDSQSNIHAKVWEAVEQDNLRHVACAQEFLKSVDCVRQDKVYGQGFRARVEVITPTTSNLTGALMWGESVRNFEDLSAEEQQAVAGEIKVRYVPEYHQRLSLFDPNTKTVWILGAQSYVGLFKKHPLCLLNEVGKENDLIMQHSGSIAVDPENIDITRAKATVKGEQRSQGTDKIFPISAPDKVNLKEYLADRIFGAHFGMNRSIYMTLGISREMFDSVIQNVIISKFKKMVIKVVAGSGTGKTATCVNADGPFNYEELKAYTIQTITELIKSGSGSDEVKSTIIEKLMEEFNYQFDRNKRAIVYLLKHAAGLRQDDMTLDQISGEDNNRKIISFGTEELGSYCMDSDVDFDSLDALPDDDLNKQRLTDPRTIWEGDPEEITKLLVGVTDTGQQLITTPTPELEAQLQQELEKIKSTLAAHVQKGKETLFLRIVDELKKYAAASSWSNFDQSYEELKGILKKTHSNLRSMCKTDIMTGYAGTIDCEAGEGVFLLCERVPHHPAVLVLVDPKSADAKTDLGATKVNAHLSSAMAINTAATGGVAGTITHSPHANPFVLDKENLVEGNQDYFRGNLDIMPFAVLNTGRIGVGVVDKNGSSKRDGEGMAVTIEDCKAIRRALMRGDYELEFDIVYNAYRLKSVPGVDPRKLNPQQLYETAGQSGIYFQSIAEERAARKKCLDNLPITNAAKYASIYA